MNQSEELLEKLVQAVYMEAGGSSGESLDIQGQLRTRLIALETVLEAAQPITDAIRKAKRWEPPKHTGYTPKQWEYFNKRDEGVSIYHLPRTFDNLINAVEAANATHDLRLEPRPLTLEGFDKGNLINAGQAAKEAINDPE